jgi:methyl-accepting chemotaxis protein
MNFLSRLNMAGKIGVMVAALLLPMGLLAYFFVSSQNDDITFARTESAGIHYYHPLEEITGRVAEHDALIAAYVAGDRSVAPRLAELDKEMSAQMADMDAVDAKYGQGSPAQAMWKDIKKGWAGIAAKGLNWTGAESLGAHAELGDKVFAMKKYIADTWNLTLDPIATTYYMIDTAVMRVPELERNIGDLRTAISGAAAAGKLSASQLRELDIQVYKIKEVIDTIHANGDVATAGADGAALRALFLDKQAKTEAAVAGLLDFVQSKFLTDGVKASVAQISQATEATAEVIDAFHDSVQFPLQDMLDARADHKATIRNWMISLTALCTLIAILLSWYISSRNARQMRAAMKVFEAIAAGKYDSPIQIVGRDEAARVLGALQKMQADLGERISQERQQSEENSRIRQALDRVTSYVMLADEKNNVIYMNQSLSGMFQSYSSDIRKQLPNFDPNRLMGTSIDVFHARPSHQQHLLSELQGTHTANLEIGGRSMRIMASPVRDAAGARLGTVVEWRDLTQEVAVEREVQFIVQKALEGDLTRRIRVSDKTGFFESLGKGINQLLDNTTELVRQITLSAAEVRTGADEISRGNSNLSQRTEQQAASLEETASSMEQMTSTVRNNADNASQASQLASNARREAETGGEVVQAAVRAMQDISQSSKRIADIIGVIDEIAFQTNLLALNAAVEAARAGEQGRGFAVVASEVRSLAGRSASAAKEIKSLINDSVAKVADGTKLVDQSGETLNAIVMSVKKVADIVAEIAAANQEQSTGIEQVDKAVTQMDQLTQQNAALVEEVAAASETLRDQAAKLATFLERYRADDTAVAPGTVAPGAKPVMAGRSPVAAKPAAKPAQKPEKSERRSAERPWSSKEAPAQAAAPKTVGSDVDGDVWKEF